jgi:hypothetical protein
MRERLRSAWLVATLALAGAGPGAAAKVEFAQARFVVEEGSDESLVLLSLRECGARDPSGVARVRVLGGDGGSAVEGEDFFVYRVVELGAVASPDGGVRLARIAQVPILVPDDGVREGEEELSLRLEPLASTLDCGAGPEAIAVGPEARVVILEPPAPATAPSSTAATPPP